ncbi:putative membrane protein [Campylobacter blaseri]|uniref:Uncharacterized protein n=1 Tax=Campylobacter blaseri TaxID=2042961 RepID=A0A2P8R1B3_9BACT|nr:hypothetical protein [Campylobacter blaseri]PSM52281.1 hypothetical protein CQ405_04300 [Campylobacter blaseri]PSM54047.1 hypothetical protein CRN67_04300 [Campylobacter blaseri]QKF85488.1 putative membrane protein [Campylobacter blaseri]
MGNLVILFFIFECLDVALNNSTKFKDLIYGYARRWAKNPIFFLLTQFNFLFLSFCIFGLGINSGLLYLLYLLYMFDSGYKVYLSHNVINNNLNKDLEMLLNSGYTIEIWQRFLFAFCMSGVFYLSL